MVHRLILASLLALPGLATAGDVSLPLDLSFCDDTVDVRGALTQPITELSEGVLEAEVEAFGIRGTATAVLSDGALTQFRFRTFDNDANLSGIRKKLEARHGEGAFSDRSSKGGDRRVKYVYSVAGEVSLDLATNSEQIYVSWEAPLGFCSGDQAPARTGLTDAEKADMEATADKPAIAFDPYAMDPEDLEEKMEAKEEKKKSEAEKEREAQKAEDPGDVDIDW